MANESITMAQSIGWALDDAMQADSKVLVLGEDVADREGGGIRGITRGLSTKYGDQRVKSTPIAEQAIMGAAIGAALAGYRPVAEIMLMNFTTVAMDMIVNHAAKLRFMSGGQSGVPLVIRTMTGSGLALAGQHSDYLESWFAHVGGIKVVAPSNSADAYGLMLAAIADPDPVLFIENVLLLRASSPAPERGTVVPLGKAKIAREGSDVTVVTHSRMVFEALEAASKLESQGISVEVIDLRTISPWDKETVLNCVRRTGRALVVHEAARPFGIGGEIAAEISEAAYTSLKGPVRRLGAHHSPVPFARALESEFAPNSAKIETAVREMLAV